MDLISFMIVVWMVKVLAEDGWATVKGQSNPRMDRRKARQKSRATNPIWNQFVAFLGDVAEDAREEQARRRKERREREAEARRKRDLEEHPRIDAEFYIDEPTPGPTSPEPGAGQPNEEDDEERRRKHDEECPDGCDPPWPTREDHSTLTADECTYDICPIHGKGKKSEPEPTPKSSNQKENTMDETGEIYGLDACIAYCEALAGRFEQHTAAGGSGEQYTGMLADAKVTGMALQSAHEMQAAIGSAVAAIESHKVEMEAQKLVQEAYDANSDAGDKDFQQAGR